MRKLKPTFLTLVVALILPSVGAAEGQPHESGGVEEASKEMMKITEHGFEPAQISFSQLDSSVFFVNSTNESLLSLQVDFGDRRAHCASENIIFEGGVMRSKVPLAPQDFALVCFPEKGSYEVIARGVAGKPTVVGKVVVR